MSYYGWKPYVPVAERRAQAAKKVAQGKKAGKDYTPVAPFRGALAKTFWGKAWCDNLERYSDYGNRLPRGRTYVRNGSVIDLKIQPGQVMARVMGSRLYVVEVAIDTVAAAKWKKIVADCAGSIHSLVDLLQGKLTKSVMERVTARETGLLPAPGEIRFSCSCPDWASMCKHVAAALYGIGARLDAQPELLFALRGVDASELIGAAAGQLDTAKPVIDDDKVLADAVLADVFGIEIASSVPAAKPKSKKPAARKSAAAKVVKRAAASTRAKAKAKASPDKAAPKMPVEIPIAPRSKAKQRKPA